jgi:hypothetical protein
LGIAQSASLEVEALRITGRQDSQTRSQLETLRLNAEKITSAADRARGLGPLRRHPGEQPLVAQSDQRGFHDFSRRFCKVGEQCPRNANIPLGQVMLAMAELALSDTSDLAPKGNVGQSASVGQCDGCLSPPSILNPRWRLN